MLEQLNQRIEEVGRRARRYRLWKRLSLCWLLAAIVGIMALATDLHAHFASRYLVMGLFGIAAIVFVLLPFFRHSREKDRLRTVRLIELAFPDLNDRLLAACEQQPGFETGRLGYLQQQVVGEVLRHSFIHDWKQTISLSGLTRASCMHLACFGLFAAVSAVLLDTPPRVDKSEMAAIELDRTVASGKEYGISVEPGHTSIERGTSLLVLARFSEMLPTQATLVVEEDQSDKPAAGLERIPLAKSLDDPIFGGRLTDVRHDLKYHVEYDSRSTERFQITVFDYPQLERADVAITFPEFTDLPETVVEDTRQVTIVEGSSVTLICRINKPIVSAELEVDEGDSLALKPVWIQTDDSKSLVPSAVVSKQATDLFQVTLKPKTSQRYTLKLRDAEGRMNKQQPTISIDVVPNQPVQLKIAFPVRDLRVSPLEEVSLEATAWDDFGIEQYGVIYSLAESDPETVVLGSDAAAKEERQLHHLLSFESLAAQPDQLVSYYFFADDIGPNGKTRRTFSDMFFAEVRHFEEIFRQGPQMPSGGKKKGGGSPNAQKAEKLAELQKQIINATWKLIRRETSTPPSADFEKDVTLIKDSQAAALKQASELAEKIRDAKSKAFISTVAKHMQTALHQLTTAVESHSASSLTIALAAEQAAYQALLKLRAREHKVSKSQNGGGGKGGGGNRSQQQLQQLELTNKQNRYETQKNASKQQASRQNREQLQVLNRLRELARRQGGVNEKLKEIENAIRLAKTEQEKEELRRQLKRLRKEQQELLQDLDSLRNRMDKPENQLEMADSRKQLEKTRSNVRQSSEALKKGQVSKALNTGTRAERQLDNLRDDFRKKTAGQFSESMRNLRDDARSLSERQKKLAQQLAEVNNKKRRTLRGSQERQQIETGLTDQKKQLNEILDEAKKIVQQAENSEPLLSKQLYDTVRKSREEKPDKALDATSQLLNRGLLDEAEIAEKQASKGVESIRRGIETAARSVLGDEVESLKRAGKELKDLTREVKDELAQASPSLQQRSDSSGKKDEASSSQSSAGNQKSTSNDKRNPSNQPAGNSKKSKPGETKSGTSSSPANGDQKKNKASQSQASGSPESKGGSQPNNASSGSTAKSNSPADSKKNSQGQQGSTGSKGGGSKSQQPGSRKASSFLTKGGLTGGRGGPLTGGDFQQWSDRMRDIEEMVEDPKLRAEIATIRERARSMRVEFKRHSKEPEWPLVQTKILKPLVELQQRIAEEIAQRGPNDALVPIDRDPVPERFSDLVRRYYEKLGSGK